MRFAGGGLRLEDVGKSLCRSAPVGVKRIFRFIGELKEILSRKLDYSNIVELLIYTVALNLLTG